MDDGRPFILMGRNQAGWRFTHGFVENVAIATALAITKREAIGRVYNVGEPDTPTWAEWARRVGQAAGWNGSVVVVPDERLPAHLAENLDFRQDWVVDTSRIRLELGYAETVSADECLKRTVVWERENEATRDPKKFDYVAEDAALAEFDADA
jgi:nucleoside-diphosphate-sugar epimerase